MRTRRPVEGALACRSPPRLRRCLWVLPEQAGTGAAPLKWPRQLRYRPGPGCFHGDDQLPGDSGPTPKQAAASGWRPGDQRAESGSRSDLLGQVWPAGGPATRRVSLVAVWGSAASRAVGRTGRRCGSAPVGQVAELARSDSGAVSMSLELPHHVRALLTRWPRATRRSAARSTAPSALLGIAGAGPANADRAAASASIGSTCPTRGGRLRLGRSTSTTRHAPVRSNAASPAP